MRQERCPGHSGGRQALEQSAPAASCACDPFVPFPGGQLRSYWELLLGPRGLRTGSWWVILPTSSLGGPRGGFSASARAQCHSRNYFLSGVYCGTGRNLAPELQATVVGLSS